MKINHIEVSNYQRLTRVSLPVRAPLLLIAGPNEAGKTSLADAIYHVCTGTARRVKLKKDFQALVHDGQKTGIVSLQIDGDGAEPYDIAVKVPTDKRSGDADLSPLLPYLLDAKLFPRLEPEARRKVLFGITGTRISGKTILEELKKKGAEPKKTVEIGAVLLAGFEAAAGEAAAKASEARGSWKATTGEVYGSKKAETWEAEKPEFDADRLVKLAADVTAAEKKVAELTASKATLDEQKRAHNDRSQRMLALQERAGLLSRAQAKLDTDQADVDQWTERVTEARAKAAGVAAVDPLTCPHCAGLVDLGRDGKLHQHTPPEQVADEKAKALLPVYEDSLRKVTAFRDNDKRALDDAKQAVAALAEFAANPLTIPDIGRIQQLESELTTAQQHLRTLRATLDDLKRAKDAAARAAEDTIKAAGFHKDVLEWAQIAEWLAPSGIQSELLQHALEPFNQRLAGTAAITGWDAVTIDSDMTIRVGGRPHSLASASAQWRAEAAIVEAMAWVSKIRTFLLDEVEILVGDNRLTFLKWMHTLAANGNIDTAILIGSFKDKPKCPPTFQVEWLERGVLAHDEQQQEAA